MIVYLFIAGSSTLSCLSVRGVRTGSCELGDATVILPQSVFKSVMIQHADDQWQVLPCNYKSKSQLYHLCRILYFKCLLLLVRQGDIYIYIYISRFGRGYSKVLPFWWKSWKR